jgi:hypothetical protein
MFRAYTVLFVGYSHDDTVMRYLARGLPRGTSRYALTPGDDLSKWRQLGIQAIPHPKSPTGGHQALTAALQEWGARVGMGLLDHRRRIADLVNAPPPDEPVDADHLADALTRETTVGFFTEAARGEAWLDWAESQPRFQQLASAEDPRDGVYTQARWFVDQFVLVEAESRRAIKTIQQFKGRIGSVLRWSARMQKEPQ